MGLIPGSVVTLEKFAPMGDPMELRIHGYELTLRLDDAKKIGIDMTSKGVEDHTPIPPIKHHIHPGLRVKVVNIMIKKLKILYQKEHRLPLR